ncbi:MAG: hypothetical protein K0Q79_3212 [Flavipsychrobacter sp.]|jgi:hypothetical protein|nr:hypothetical protein [Flavipsychrobacter sp.]
MKTSSGCKGRRFIPAGFLAMGLLLSGSIMGQDREKYDGIAAKNKGQHAVYTQIKKQLVIEDEGGVLTAQSNVVMEKLFLTDYSTANNNVDLFGYSDFHRPVNYSGYSYIPVSQKKYKKVECEAFVSGKPSSYVFYDDNRLAGAYYSGLCKNAITETKYSIWHTDVHMLPDFDFQRHLPVAEAVFEVVAPDYVKMKFVLKGQNTAAIKETKEEKNGKVYYRFTATNMPAAKSFSNVPSTNYYVPHVIPYIASYRIPGAKKDSVLANSPADLYKYLYNYVRGKNIRQDTFLNNTAMRITQDAATDREKAARIYKWVQDNIHYIAIENGLEGFVPRSADTVYKRKYGDCKDMSSILMAMCRKVGLKAYFVWIGSNELPYTHEETPLSCISDHMIAVVKLGDEWVFMDGTHSSIPFGYNPAFIQGKEAMIAIDENNYEIVTIPVTPASKNVTIDSTYLTLDGKKIAGSLNRQYKGYYAWELGMWLAGNRDQEDRRKMVRSLTSRGASNYDMKKYTINAGKDGDKDVSVDADFVVDDYVQYAGKECIVNMNMLRTGMGRIDTKDRNVANYFKNTGKYKEVVVMNIPKGYKLKYLPQPAKGSLGDQWKYSVSYKADKNSITLTKEYELNTLAIATDKFADNNKLVDELKKVYRESIVLTTN